MSKIQVDMNGRKPEKACELSLDAFVSFEAIKIVPPKLHPVCLCCSTRTQNSKSELILLNLNQKKLYLQASK